MSRSVWQSKSGLGHGPKFSLGANLVGTTSDSRHRSQPRGFLSRANMRHGVVEAERQIKRPPTEAALLAPAMFTAFAFEHAHGLACPSIQHLTNEPGHRIASRAALAGIHRLIADFTVEDLAKFQANDLKPRWDGLDAKIKGLVFWLRKSGSPRQSASRTCK